MTWAEVSIPSRPFTFHNQNGLLGIETSAQVIRTEELRTFYNQPDGTET